MASQVMNFINTGISAASQLFLRVFTGSGMIEVYFAIIFIILAIKFIISPVIGKSRGSDRARSNKEVNSDE